MITENNNGTGAVKDIHDPRDYQYSQIAQSIAPYDWSKNFDIETIIGIMPVKNQYQSFSCGGQAWSSYSYVLDALDRTQKSAKFIYAQTHVGTGGSDGRTNCKLCVSKGICKETLCSSYLPDNTTTEPYMTDASTISSNAFADATSNEEKSYLAVATDIDSVAQAIENCNGVVLGITGQNNGTWLTAFPLPPVGNTGLWNHWVYAGKVQMIEGKKYIGILNSWGNTIGQKGWQWLSEDYFKNQNVWACWTMIHNATSKFVFTQTLKMGSIGLDVKMLQTRLGITADGIYGRHTRDAVMTYQAINGLKADGVVGPLTIKKLNI